MKHEYSTDTDISATVDLKDANDGERQPSRQNRCSNSKVSFFRRIEGDVHTGIETLVPYYERYDRLMSFRDYCLADTTTNRSWKTTTRLHRRLKNIKSWRKDFKISGEDPILILDFLNSFV